MQWNPSSHPLAVPESSDYQLPPNNFSAVWSSNASFGACNITGNCTITDGPMAILKVSILELVIACSVLAVLILCTLIGNVFVIAAVVLERNLHNVANYLIVSLAVADLMVAGLVMPIAALNEMTQVWILGPEVCDMWVSFDVLCCTASILHLVAIALDRFWAITNIDYAAKRTAKRIIWMIVIVWVTAIVVSITPLFGWKNEGVEYSCQITQDIGYTLFSTLCAFYIPLSAMGVIYWKIFQAAKFRIRKKAERGARRHVVDKNLSPTGANEPSQFRMENSVVITKERNSSIVEENTAGPLLAESSFTQGNSNGLPAPSSDAGTVSGSVSPTERLVPVPLQPTPASLAAAAKNNPKRFKIDIKRERKAAKTLGIVMGVFTICWLPFFTHALIAPICKDNCPFPQPLVSIFVWLGYVNSLLNPVIYTIFSPDFREAFKKILSYRSRRRRAHF